MVQFLNTATLSASKLASTDSQVLATDSTTDKNIFCQSLLRCGCPTGFSRLLTGVYYGDDGDGVGDGGGDDGDGGSAAQQASACY